VQLRGRFRKLLATGDIVCRNVAGARGKISATAAIALR